MTKHKKTWLTTRNAPQSHPSRNAAQCSTAHRDDRWADAKIGGKDRRIASRKRDPSHLPVRYLATAEGSKTPEEPPSFLLSACAEDGHLGPRPTQPVPVPAPLAHHLRETKHHHHHQQKSVTQPCGDRHHEHPSSPHPESEVTYMITRRKAQQRGKPRPEYHPAAVHASVRTSSVGRSQLPGSSPQTDRDTGAPWAPPAEQCFHCSSCIVKQEPLGGYRLCRAQPRIAVVKCK